MIPQHDASTGRVRCDDTTLDALLSDRTTAPAPMLEDPRSLAALDAIDTALVAGRLVVAGPAGVLDHRFWIAPGAAAFFLALGEGHDENLSDLVSAAPTWVPRYLARLVHLGPRRVEPQRATRETTADLLEDALHPSDLRRSSALLELGAGRAWRLDVLGSHDDPEADRSMTVLDGASGYWLVDGTNLEPTTAGALWRQLTTVLG